MRKLVLISLASVFFSQAAVAAGTHYEMRVDGLACPFCAYGIEKKLKSIDGVSNIHVDLDNGLVTVDMAQGGELTEAQMKELFNDAGFSYRGMKKTSL